MTAGGGPSLCGRGHPWAGRAGLYKNVSGASPEGQASEQHLSVALVLPPGACPDSAVMEN